MVKGDNDELMNNKLYLDNKALFEYYLFCVIEFSQEYDPTEALMDIATDDEKTMFIEQAPDEPVTL